MDRLEQVVYTFPAAGQQSRQFFAVMLRLFEGVEGTLLTEDQVQIVQPGPGDLLPKTVLRLGDVPRPTVLLDMAPPIHLRFDSLILKTPQTSIDGLQIQERAEPPAEGYVRLPADSEDFTALLPVDAACERLKGHVFRLDHTGLNIPAASLDRAGWDDLLHKLSSVSAIYRYPTGEDWPFVIPATAAEVETDITESEPMRRPKFELVYDTYLRNPLLQFDMETDLTREEVEGLFPPPYGVGLPGLDQYFRSVYVYHPWPGLSIRFDMGYRYDPPGDMAGWLIREGGRIR